MTTSNDLEQAIVSVVGADKLAQPVFAPDEDVAPPYVRLMPGDAERVSATDRTWIWQIPYDVILCTTYRDRALERQMIWALDGAGVGFDLSFGYDERERVFLAVFTTDPVEESEE